MDGPIPQPFVAVAPRPRRDGWTAAIQQRFIVALAAGRSVREACRHVGRSRNSAYVLRRRDDSASFAAAWDAATASIEAELVGSAMERCLEGTAVPVFYRGRQVGERVKYDNGLLMFLLRRRELGMSWHRQSHNRAQ